MNKIIVAGIGPGGEDFMSPAAREAIDRARYLVGGRRALNQFAKPNQTICAVTGDLSRPIDFIRSKLRLDDVTVMVSGDPGYYSMLDLLRKNFPPSSIEVIPSISAMQLAFARLALPWHGATLLSFHGRQPAREFIRYEAGKTLGLLTDATNNSASIAALLLECGWADDSTVTICERLSYPDERVQTLTLAAAAQAPPVKHCILIVREEKFIMTEIKNPSVFAVGKPLPEQFSKYFIGQAYLNPLTAVGGAIANVTFEPGCRNNWHVHHKGGQILLVTGGRGWYQEWGKEPQALKPGDVVNIAPEVKHWHGAAADSWFSHLAVEIPAEDASNEWLEPVDDAQYSRLEALT